MACEGATKSFAVLLHFLCRQLLRRLANLIFYKRLLFQPLVIKFKAYSPFLARSYNSLFLSNGVKISLPLPLSYRSGREEKNAWQCVRIGTTNKSFGFDSRVLYLVDFSWPAFPKSTRHELGQEEIAFWQIMSLQQGKYWY